MSNVYFSNFSFPGVPNRLSPWRTRDRNGIQRVDNHRLFGYSGEPGALTECYPTLGGIAMSVTGTAPKNRLKLEEKN